MPVAPPKFRSSFLLAFWCALLLVIHALAFNPAAAQPPTQAVPLGIDIESSQELEKPPGSKTPTDKDHKAPTGNENGNQKADAAELPGDDVLQSWVEALGSDEFAARERAAVRLVELGTAILPTLRKAAEETDDPEIRLRAEELVKQLTRGDLEARIESFLVGEDVQFEGWRVARALLGDTTGARELFVQMMRSHPQLAASLEGTPRDRAMAMEAVASKVHLGMTVQRRLPTAADAVAMLLPANDPNVPINGAFENVLMSVLHYEQANRIRRDIALATPFKALVGGWARRSTLSNRQDVLFLALDWELPQAALPLGLQTLRETNATDTLSIALQTIARFGERSDAAAVVPLLDDTRPASENGFAPGQSARTQLGDVAMAAVALLHDVPLSEVGFESAEEHPKFGFVLSEIGFPANDPEKRKAARAKIDQLLKPAPPAEKS